MEPMEDTQPMSVEWLLAENTKLKNDLDEERTRADEERTKADEERTRADEERTRLEARLERREGRSLLLGKYS